MEQGCMQNGSSPATDMTTISVLMLVVTKGLIECVNIGVDVSVDLWNTTIPKLRPISGGMPMTSGELS